MSREVPFDAVRAWMFDAALPLWAARGVDTEHGGFFEELDAAGAPTACTFKRVRVICRQTYVFSHAALLGWQRGAELSLVGFEYLMAHARTPDGSWAKVLSREGEIIDATPDLYDLAFVIYAAAWRYRVSNERRALNCALEALAFIEDRMRAPNGGFWPSLPHAGQLRQNPHMHLTEACLAAFEATREARFLDVAREVITLFRTHFFDGNSLGERFDAHWRRTSAVLEPGHHFEWAWILAEFNRLSGDDVAPLSEKIAAFAERVGVDPHTGLVYDAINEEGAVEERTSRLWTNTERLKAALALFELSGRDTRPMIASSLRRIFDHHMADQIPGLWIDRLDERGSALSTAVPASCVYHVFLAFAEVLRLEPRLRRLP